MSELETTQPLLPSLRIERKVQNIDPDILARFTVDVGKLGTRSSVRPLLSPDAYVLMLGSEETLLHYRVARHQPSIDDIDELGDYLEGALPDYFDDPIDLSTQSITEAHYSKSVGTNKSGRRPESLFIAGRDNDQIVLERERIRGLIADYFNYSERRKLSISRHVSDEKTGVHLIQARSLSRIEVVNDAFEAGNITLPETITLGRAVIVDT